MNCPKCKNTTLQADKEKIPGLDFLVRVLVCPICGFKKNPINKKEKEYWDNAEKYVPKKAYKQFDHLEGMERIDSTRQPTHDDKQHECCQDKPSNKCGGCGGSCGGK
jgi:hypothetical protein